MADTILFSQNTLDLFDQFFRPEPIEVAFKTVCREVAAGDATAIAALERLMSQVWDEIGALPACDETPRFYLACVALDSFDMWDGADKGWIDGIHPHSPAPTMAAQLAQYKRGQGGDEAWVAAAAMRRRAEALVAAAEQPLVKSACGP